jgi:hypothetical protein
MNQVSIEHIAGPMSKYGVQRCLRCGEVLTDYRNALVVEGTLPLSGWPRGPVFVTGNATTLVPVGDDAVPCQGPYHQHTCRRCGEEWLHGYGKCPLRGEPSEDCPACEPAKYV